MCGSAKALGLMKNALFKVENVMLLAIEEIYLASSLHVGFSKKGASEQLNGLFMFDGLRKMLERNVYCILDMVFPFIGPFLDRCIEMLGKITMMTVHKLFSDPVHKDHVGSVKFS